MSATETNWENKEQLLLEEPSEFEIRLILALKDDEKIMQIKELLLKPV